MLSGKEVKIGVKKKFDKNFFFAKKKYIFASMKTNCRTILSSQKLTLLRKYRNVGVSDQKGGYLKKHP